MNELGRDNFYEFIKKNKIVFIDFYSDWCSPCKKVPPLLEKLKEEFSEIEIGKISAVDFEEIAQEFGIFSVPVIVVFKDGKEIKRFMGVPSYNELKSMVL